MLQLILYIFSGLLGVSNMILWGVYGDLVMEPFEKKKVIRSIMLAVIYSIIVYMHNTSMPLFIVALNVIAFERVTTEIYKALIRKESQDKYLIPSDLNLKIQQPLKKPLGFFLILLVVLAYMYVIIPLPAFVLMLLAVLIPAIGGAMKDAPYEGFDKLKFFRSPLVGTLMGVFLLIVFPRITSTEFLFALWGAERIISESYKKVIKGNVPGKFKEDAAHPVNLTWKRERSKLLVLYWGSIALLILLAIISQ